MAVDSARKRFSAMGMGQPRTVVIPDGSIAANDRLSLVGVYPFNAGLGVAPTVVSSSISVDGDSLVIVFSESVQDGGSGLAGISGTPSGGAATFTYSSGAGTAELTYSISRTLDYGETITNLAYTQPGDGIEAVDDNTDVASFSGVTVNNQSLVNRPFTFRTGLSISIGIQL